MPNTFDFSKLPNIVSWHAGIDPLEENTRSGFKKYTRAYSRYICSVRQISWSRNPPNTPEENTEQMQKGCLRASLSDFKTIVEVLPLDLSDLGDTSTAMDIHTPQNPLFSFLSELRNQNIHFYTPDIQERNRQNVQWAENEFEYAVYGLQLSKVEFLNLRNIQRHWNQTDAEKIFDWFEKTQNEYGFREIILHANLQMAREVVAHHG